MSPTWVPVPDHSEFPLHSLPFGVIDPGDGARIVVAIGDHALDMRALAGAGLLDVEPGVAPALSSNDRTPTCRSAGRRGAPSEG